MNTVSLAIAYDFLQVRGGAELFSLILRDHYPRAKLWVSAVNRDMFGPNELNRVEPLKSSLPLGAASRALAAWRNFRSLRPGSIEADTALLSGHYAPLAIEAFQARRKLLYLHCPPLPFVWCEDDRSRLNISAPLRPFAAVAMRRLAADYSSAITKADLVLANSQFTANMFQQRFNSPVRVLHPPVPVMARWRPSEGYYLSFARHEPYKRIDRVIDAFRLLPTRRLVIASTGSDTMRLKRLARNMNNILFTDQTDHCSIQRLIERCIATVHVSCNEPFGISAVESLAAGKPIIVAGAGGLAEIVAHQETGWALEPDPEDEAIAAAVAQATASTCDRMRSDCEKSAQRFSMGRFLSALNEILLGGAEERGV